MAHPTQRLFFLSHIDPLDNVPLHHVKEVTVNGAIATIRMVDDEGIVKVRKKPFTDFIRIQVDEFIHPKHSHA